jgi:predicted dinucleotide-binding enzyme
MNIAILGSGIVAQVLGAGFASRGHTVMMGTRDPASEKVQAWIEKTEQPVTAGTSAEAAAFCEMAVLATAWSGTENALNLAGADNLAGKVVIDVTNPLVFAPNASPSLALGHTDSGGEQVQRWLPGSKVVKAFNIVGNTSMIDPDFPDGPPDMFICGNDDDAKKLVTEILDSFGWPTIDIGGIEGARLLEPMCILWVMYGITTGGWDHAFKMLRK